MSQIPFPALAGRPDQDSAAFNGQEMARLTVHISSLSPWISTSPTPCAPWTRRDLFHWEKSATSDGAPTGMGAPWASSWAFAWVLKGLWFVEAQCLHLFPLLWLVFEVRSLNRTARKCRVEGFALLQSTLSLSSFDAWLFELRVWTQSLQVPLQALQNGRGGETGTGDLQNQFSLWPKETPAQLWLIATL